MYKNMNIPDPSEHQIQNYVLSLFNANGFFLWRNNSALVHVQDRYGKSRMFRAGIKGGADIIGIAPDGKFCAFEIKRKGKQPTLIQKEFIRTINVKGGYGRVIDSPDEADRILKLLLTIND